MTGRPRLAAAAVGMFAAVTVLGACATLPSSGPAQVTGVQGVAGQAPAQEGVQLIPVPPGPSWTPRQIVSGFLVASASFAGNHAVARQYLSSSFSRTWNPGWAATVVDPVPNVTGGPVSSHVTGGPTTAEVSLTSQYLATLQTAGRYEAGHLLVSSGSHVFHFVLVQSTGQWRIAGVDVGAEPSTTLLLLTRPDFVRDYQPRNLYFVPTASAAQVLVPDPVFIPQQAGATGAAIGLVKALLGPPLGWLYKATTTAFPAGTKLTSIQVAGIKAVVDLGGNAARAGPRQLQQMAAQLVWSLTSTSYATPSDIRSVVLQVNHKDFHTAGGQVLLPKDYTGWVSHGPTGPLYFQAAVTAAQPAVRILQAQATGSAPQALPNGLGRQPFSVIAISPVTADLTVFAGCRGLNVYAAAFGHSSPVVTHELPAACTSLSWDSQGNLWATAGSNIYMLPAGEFGGEIGGPLLVTDPALPSSDPVTSLRVAPDGVRVAIIVHTKGGAKVLVAAISRTTPNIYLAQSDQMVTVGSDIADPVALSWLDPDDLLVLDQPSGAASQLYEVPLNGGTSHQVATPLGATSVAANGSRLVVGTVGVTGRAHGQILTSPGLSGPWRPVAPGSSPVYPG